MSKLPEELIKNFLNDGTAKGLGDLSMMVSHIITAHSQGVEEGREDVIRLKQPVIDSMMEEIRYLRSSQPERRKPVIRIRIGDDWHIPMITEAHDTPAGLYIEAEMEALTNQSEEKNE